VGFLIFILERGEDNQMRVVLFSHNMFLSVPVEEWDEIPLNTNTRQKSTRIESGAEPIFPAAARTNGREQTMRLENG
jgi:hypothetical protein